MDKELREKTINGMVKIIVVNAPLVLRPTDRLDSVKATKIAIALWDAGYRKVKEV